jgi:4-hydroxyproline epimerase
MPGELWRQEGILGTVFEGSYRIEEGTEQRVIPSVTGSAWITAESRLLLQEDDPFRMGIQAPVRSMAFPD